MANPPSPQQQAAQILAGQYRPLEIAENARRVAAAKQQASLKAAQLALVGELGKAIAPAGQAYDAALAQQQALAQAGAQGLAQASPNDQIQHDLAAVNAPAEQRTQLARQLGQQFGGQGAVLNIEQGTVPGASLVAQKAAVQQRLGGLPAVATLAGDDLLRALLAADQAQRSEYQGKRAQVGAQLPALTLDIENTRADRAMQERQFEFQQRQLASQVAQAALERQWRSREAELDRASQSAITPYQQAQIRLERERIQTERQQAKASGYAPEIVGSSEGGYYIVNPNTGQAAQVVPGTKSSASKPGSTRGLTPTTIQRYKGIAATIADHARHGFSDPHEKDESGQPVVHPALTYDDAVQEMRKAGVPLALAVAELNAVYPVQYRVTPHGLKQIGIKGQPSTFGENGYVPLRPRRRKRGKRGK